MQAMIILVVAVALIAMLIASVTLARNPSSSVHQWMFAFISSASIWIVATSSHGLVGSDWGLWVVRASFGAALMLGFSMAMFVNSLTGSNSKKAITLFTICLALGEVLSFSPLVVKGYDIYRIGESTVLNRGAGYALVVALTLAFVLYAITKLWMHIRKSRGVRKLQLEIIEWGLIAGTIAGTTTNVVLPVIADNTGPGRFSFVAIIIWTTLLVYAVVQHRFLNIRLAAARTVAYITSLIILALLYAGGIVLGIRQVLGINVGSASAQAIYVFAALILAMTFHPLRRQVDKLTNSIFFRHAYDTNQALDRIGSILVEDIQTEELLKKVGGVIMDSVRPLQIQFFVTEDSKVRKQISLGKDFRAYHILDMVQNNPDSMVIADEIDQESSELNHLLVKNGLSMSVKLQTVDQVTGFMLVGNKSSGSALTRQDVELIRIIASELAVAVQNAMRFEEIEKFSETLEQKVDEATRQLKRKNERLRLLDQTKDDFISMASHQLRTPLTSIKGYTSMVLEGDAGRISPLQRKLLNQSFVSAQRMVYLISDLLNVSRLRTGKFELELVPTSLAAVIAGEVGQLKETAQARNLELTYVKPEHFPDYMLDETKMRQVIMNFIDNAIYYTPSGGKIDVSLTDKPESIELTVTDTGIGVPKRDQPQMFTKYFRAHNAQIARPDGTGLGLFMAKKVIIAHGGAVIFSSREHRGSTFGFTISKKYLQTPPPKDAAPEKS